MEDRFGEIRTEKVTLTLPRDHHIHLLPYRRKSGLLRVLRKDLPFPRPVIQGTEETRIPDTHRVVITSTTSDRPVERSDPHSLTHCFGSRFVQVVHGDGLQ